MPIIAEPTPNPNAMKFTVGRSVEEPKTYVAGQESDDPVAGELLDLPGVTSVFMSADFITLSKSSEGSWEEIIAEAERILEEHFG